MHISKLAKRLRAIRQNSYHQTCRAKCIISQSTRADKAYTNYRMSTGEASWWSVSGILFGRYSVSDGSSSLSSSSLLTGLGLFFLPNMEGTTTGHPAGLHIGLNGIELHFHPGFSLYISWRTGNKRHYI